MGRRNRSALLPTNIPQLQNLLKRDPKSYEAEFEQQYRHFEASLSIFKLKPDDEAKNLGELINFISQVSQCFPERTAEFPGQMIDLLQEHYQVLNPDLRKNIVQALILLRNKNIVDNTRLLPLFFTLFRCRDKALRELLYTHIVNDIRNANSKVKNNKLNKTLQSFMFTILESVKSGNSDENAIAAKRSVDVCIELYRKNVWNDAKTVNVIAEACFSPITKIAVTAIQFFLGNNEEQEDDSDDEDDVPDLRKMQQANLHNKKTKAKARKIESVKKKIHKKKGFCEKLFSKLSGKEDRWEVRLMKLNLITRIIGVHQLTLLALYPFLIKYLQPSQRDVTMVLVSAAQATHPLVPPDVLEPVLKAIANNFVTDRVSNEVMAAGINGIREICSRQPLAIDATLLQDLTEYKNHRDKGVMMGARSLISLYREVNPELLKRKDRGKEASIGMKDFKTLQYGSADATGAEGINGIEFLNEGDEEANDDDNWDNWEVEDDSDEESEDGWVNVPESDDGEAIDVDMSDSDEEKEDKEKAEDGTKKVRRMTRRAMKKKGLADLEEVELTEEQKSKKLKDLELKKAEEEKRKEAALKLATSRILTPADFAKMNDMRVTAKADVIVNGKRKADTQNEDEVSSEYVAESAILGPRKKAKQDYEERMASIREGREGREKFGSKKGKTDRGSTTNREKSRNKNFLMISHKRSVVAKSKASLHDKQKQLRAHIKKQKMKKH
ncbi:SDA1-domain-containing protein [Umbelopsis sp. PMI_123]|nr:SDA1-domain-containing protein [Umbelopsis sp. PMI_123]